MEYEYSWSELLLPPLEFDFGPKLKQGERHVVQFKNPDKFLAQQEIRPIPSGIFSRIDMSQYFIQFAVNSAVYVKGTTIPDRLTTMTENIVEFSSVMDQHYAIKQRVKQIAYHNAPGLDHQKRKQIEAEGKIVTDIHEDACLVTFCVGGHTFTTQLINLVPRKRSKLGRLVFERKSLDTIFIDRDGTHFRHVLNYLRGSESISHIRDPSVLADLLEEARFYELPDLEEKIMSVQLNLISSAEDDNLLKKSQ